MLNRSLQAFVFGVDLADPVTYASMAVALLAISGLGCWIPARRATASTRASRGAMADG